MEKNINVSIAGINFTLDAEAYRILKEYLVRIEMGYKENPDGREIQEDIEARIGELILNEQAAEVPVGAKLMKSIVDHLGLPDDLAAAGTEIPYEESRTSDALQRRLYRNMDGAKLGGVCNGLATYFNTEPLGVRLLFCSPVIILPLVGFFHMAKFAGFLGVMTSVSFMLYFIMWFAIPKARTPRQKLEMRGDKITANSIKENFREDFEEYSSPERSERNASVLGDVIYFLGKVFLFIVKAVLILIGISIGLSLLAAIFGVIVAVTAGTAAGLWAVLGISGIGGGGVVVLSILFALLPLVLIIYMLVRLVFNTSKGKTTMSVLFGVWLITFVFLGVMVARNLGNIREAVESGRVEQYFDDMEDDWEDGRWLWRGRHSDHKDPDYWKDKEQDWDQAHQEYSGTGVDTMRVDTLQVNGEQVIDTTRVEYFTTD